jgi:hypothetical protein
LSLRQNGRGEGVTFNGAHGSPSVEDSAKYSATGPGEQGEFAQA